MSALVRLYPRAWRERYETEFLGILEARPPSRRDRVDIVRGALDARLHPETPDRSPVPPAMATARAAGITAIVGGAASLAWTGLILRDFKGWDAGIPESAAVGGALAVITYLSLAVAHGSLAVAGQGSMRAAGSPGASIAVVAFLFAAGGGLPIGIGAAGSVVLAGAMAGRTIPAWLSTIWIVASALLVGSMLAFVAGDGRDVGLLAFTAPFGLAWLVVGLWVLRHGVPAPAVVPSNSR
jgi:hypothetical protein